MKTTLKRRPGFFTVNKGYVADLGPEWPDGAVASLKRARSCIVYDNGQALVLEGGRLDDALSQCEQALATKRYKAGVLGRAVGHYGDSVLFERMADLATDDAADVAVLNGKQVDGGGREMKRCHLALKASGSGRMIEGWASTPNVDRDYDIVLPTAFNESLLKFMQNPMMLLNHRSELPIGKIVDFQVKPDGLWVKGEIAKGTQAADDTWALVQQGVLKTFSVQFIILEREIEQPDQTEPGDPLTPLDPNQVPTDGSAADYQIPIRKITKAELLEVSIVSIPCNREATFSVAKAIKAGTDLRCIACGMTDCECADAAAVLPYRAGRIAPVSEVIELGQGAIVKALGLEADRMARLVDRPLAAPFKHHGLHDGDLAVDAAAVRCALASVLAYSDQGGDALTEPERKAAFAHLHRHARDAGFGDGLTLGKGPCPELMAGIIAPLRPTVLLSASEGFPGKDDAAAWLTAHGFTGEPRPVSGGWIHGPDPVNGAKAQGYLLDRGVQAVLYRAPVNVAKTGAAASPALAEGAPAPAPTPAPASPAPQPAPATPSPAAPAPAPGTEKEPEGEREVEIEVEDLNALRLAANGGGPGLTVESLEHALSSIEVEPA